MGCRIIQGDCREVLRTLPAESVHTVVTSPPYWALRSYLPEGHPDKCREIGMEQTPEEYVTNLAAVFAEVWRVLHPTGTLWLNIADSYVKDGVKTCGPQTRFASSGLQRDGRSEEARQRTLTSGFKAIYARTTTARFDTGLRPKNLVGIPWRVAFALQEFGWILRMDNIWFKPNCKPESVEDRPTKAHEYVFLFSKSERYFYDPHAVREPWADDRQGRDGSKRDRVRNVGGRTDGLTKPNGIDPSANGGRNRRSVWVISPSPYSGAHTAVMPPDLAAICIKAGTSEWGCCPVCLSPWERILEDGDPLEAQQRACGGSRQGEYHGRATKDFAGTWAEDASALKARILTGMVEKRTVGWRPTCRCREAGDAIRCTVLDPFGGTGTTGLVATKLGHDAIVIELNPETIPQAYERNRQLGFLI